MKRKIQTGLRIVCLLSFLAIVGTIGACDNEALSASAGFIRASIFTGIFGATAYLGGLMY